MSMKPPKRPIVQLHLPMPREAGCFVPDSENPALVLALVELLIDAALVAARGLAEGEGNESEIDD
jgi:hypothetical protein